MSDHSGDNGDTRRRDLFVLAALVAVVLTATFVIDSYPSIPDALQKITSLQPVLTAGTK